MKPNVYFLLIWVGLVSLVFSTESKNKFLKASPNYQMTFPRDFGPHSNFRTDWWYYTGNLQTASGRRFGYQLTFFRNGMVPKKSAPVRKSRWGVHEIFFAHFAITDVQNQNHQHAEKYARGIKELAKATSEPFHVSIEDWFVEGKSPGEAKASAQTKDMEIQLDLKPQKPLALQGINGFSQKSFDPSNASQYYSFTRIQTSGRLRIGKETFEVTGLSWMDQEFSTSLLEKTQQGWDWFSIQLSDNTEIMVFQLRDERGPQYYYRTGTFVNSKGQATPISIDEVRFESTKTWKSPSSKGVYPIHWVIQIPKHNLDLNIQAVIPNQEMQTGIEYWEGAIDVSGTKSNRPISGQGYLEMTGYTESIQRNFDESRSN